MQAFEAALALDPTNSSLAAKVRLSPLMEELRFE